MEGLSRKRQGQRNNAQGHHFEDYISGGCRYYEDEGIAKIQKTPEPFRTLRKYRDGTATVRFTGNAEPDYIGCYEGGDLVVFEAKRTLTDKMKQNAVTEHQWKSLDKYDELGANAGVCVSIGGDAFWINWQIWKNMKKVYGRKYIMAADIQPFKVKFNGSVLFLDAVDDEAFAKENGRIAKLLRPLE